VKQNTKLENYDTKKKKQDPHKRTKESSGTEEEAFDRSAAFFTTVVNKKKKVGVIADSIPDKNKSKDKQANGKEAEADDIDPTVLRSRQLAIRGNEMANLGHYQAAIDLFTEAIKLDPKDFRFFGNRSYCFDRQHQFEKALRDAEKAISLAPDWPKGYFRKGRALAGLEKYVEAEQAFIQVLKLDRNCDDGMQELLRVRTHQIMEMGFAKPQAEAAVRQHSSVQHALDSLLAGVVAENSLAGEVYESDDDASGTPVIRAPTTLHNRINNHKTPSIKMDSSNPEGLTALWVGNVLPEVSEKKLIQMFSKYGSVSSVRMLPEKFCAFVNYKSKDSASKAMQYLQGADCAGQRLLIKFPDNPLTNGNVVIRKNAVGPTVANQQPSSSTKSFNGEKSQVPREPSVTVSSKVTGPVNGDECYFWRTTGCSFGKNCRFKHLPEKKGIDKKPWQCTKFNDPATS